MNTLKEASHCPEIDHRWTLENEASGVFLAAKDFEKPPEGDGDARETQPGFYKMAYDDARCFYDAVTMFLRSLLSFGTV